MNNNELGISLQNIGDIVTVKFPNNVHKTGKIVNIYKNYGPSGKTRYEVHGKDFITITSSDSFLVKQ